MSYSDDLRRLSSDFDHAIKVAKKEITGSALAELAQLLAGIYAPSGSMALALGGEVTEWVRTRSRGLNVDTNYKGTQNIAIRVGDPGDEAVKNPVIVTAHGDEISYWVSYYINRGEVSAWPLHVERKSKANEEIAEELDAVALRYSDASPKPRLEVIARGSIFKDGRRTKGGDPQSPSFTSNTSRSHSAIPLQPGDRVVFDPQPRLSVAGPALCGIIDNRVGVAILLSALTSFAELARGDRKLAGLFVITDDEEGISEPPVFASGAQRLADALKHDPSYEGKRSTVITIDGHEYEEEAGSGHFYSIQPNPLLGGIISEGRGLALPLQSVWRMRTFSEFIASIGAAQAMLVDEMTEDDKRGIVKTSRSDDDGFRRAGKHYYDIYALGYGVQRSHHQGGDWSEASLPNVVATAQWLLVALVAACHGLL